MIRLLSKDEPFELPHHRDEKIGNIIYPSFVGGIKKKWTNIRHAKKKVQNSTIVSFKIVLFFEVASFKISFVFY